MMIRKKLTNEENFVFNDAEIVAPLGKSVQSKRPSVQSRLFPKAQTNKPTFNPPSPGPSPSTPGRNIQYSPSTPGCNIQYPPSIPGRNILADWMRPRVDDDSVNQECPTSDPCVEEVVAKLAKFNMESRSTKLPQVASKSGVKEVFDPFESYHKNMSSSPQNPNKVKDKFVNYQSGKTTEKNQVMSFRKPGAVSRPISPLTPPFSPDDEDVKQKGNLERTEDNGDSCICTRPLKLILCPVCSHTTTGRIRQICQAHPAAVFLLDISACPSCKETKFVLKEYDLPAEFIPVVNNLVT